MPGLVNGIDQYMNKNISLRALMPGERAVVKGIDAGGEQHRRLRELGLTDGTPVECVLRRKGISAYLIRGAVIALRDKDSGPVGAVVTDASDTADERSCAVWL